MQNVRQLLVAVFSFSTLFATAQNQEVIQNYINEYREIAIAEMQRSGVPASIKLAQGIHETMAGTSELVTKSNNHFGIKCKANWSGESVSHDDDARGECFRKYSSPADSYRDHSDFLKNSQRYASLFKLDPLDYTAWAYGLKKAGYATNPRYPQVIIKLIEDYHLQDYTLIALGRAPEKAEILARNTQKDDDNGITPAIAISTTDRKDEVVQKIVRPVKNYPSGEFKINDTKVIYAKEGTAYLTIAEQYHIPLARLFEFNEMQPCEVVAADDLVFLQRKRKTGANEFHTVAPGESLRIIAQEEAIRLSSLLEYNQLQAYMQPAEGQQLYLKSKAPARPLLAASETIVPADAMLASNGNIRADNPVAVLNSSNRYTLHTVQPKETVYSISRKYNVSIEDIAEWNQMSSYELKKGQQLKIYK